MVRLLKPLLAAVLLSLSTGALQAFSLLGPLAPWQVTGIGYGLGDVGGPMNLGEEYRWNVPVITYGYDRSFLDYFGATGVAEIEKAIAVFNALPAMSSLSLPLDEYPLESKRINHQAAALGILDLKSWAMSAILEQLGLAGSTRYVWTLRARQVVNNIPGYLVYQRSFDPVTWSPSPFVNETLFTYQILQITGEPGFDAVEIAVDPLMANLRVPVSAGVENGGLGFGGLFGGEFFTGLTRDDVGGLRYIYRAANANNENIAPGTTLSTATIGIPGTGGGTPGTIGGIGGPGQRSPWDDPFGFTNFFFTNIVTGTGGSNVFGGGNTPGVVVDASLRLGINKLQFTRLQQDSAFGFFAPLTNVFFDTFVTNGILFQQRVQRVITTPDILFAAGDLGVTPGNFPVPFTFLRSFGAVNNGALNTASGLAMSGPGVILPGQTIIFGKIGAYNVNVDFPPFLSGVDLTDQGSQFRSIATWGSFDGSTNAPVVYPVGSSIRDLEQRAFGQ